MRIELLAAEALLLALEHAVIAERKSAIPCESWDAVFEPGGALFAALIPFHQNAPFSGLDLPSREHVQLVYETYRSRLDSLSCLPPVQACRLALASDQIFPDGCAFKALRPVASAALERLLAREFAA